MIFYTIKTSVDLVSNKEAAQEIVNRIGYFSQVEMSGEPFAEKKFFLMRFALRGAGFPDAGEELIEILSGTPFGFTAANTSIIKADRL